MKPILHHDLSNTDSARGYAVGLVSAAVLSLTAIFIRYLTQTYHLPSLVLAFWRDTFVTLTLLPVLGLLRPRLLEIRRQDLFYLVGYGLVLATFNTLWTLSVALSGATISTVLVYSSAAFTALLGWWFLRERLHWAKGLAIVLSLTGCVLVSGAWAPAAWDTQIVGILSGVLSGLCYAVYSLMGRSASQRGLNPWTTLLYTFAFAALFLLIGNLLPGGWIPGAAQRPGELLWLGSAAAGWIILFLLAAGPTVIGFGLYNVSLVYLPSSVANLVSSLEPAFTAVIAYLLLHERLGGTEMIGSLIILSGVVVLRLGENRRVNLVGSPSPQSRLT